MSEKKRKQHYVWKHYLAAWTVSDQVWCLRGGKQFVTNTENIAHRRDFYRLREMSEKDLALVMMLIEPMGDHLKELARGWIPAFTELFRIQKLYRESGQQNVELEKELDIATNNLEEDLHGSVEDSAVPILKALRQGDFTVLDDQQRYVDFARFIATQHLRTSVMGNKMIQNAGPLAAQLGARMENILGILRTIFATTIGFHFFSTRDSTRLTLLDALPPNEFITGDQPLLNPRADGVTPPTDLELFYYPLTPNRALLMDFSHARAIRETRILSAEEVRSYNQKIMKASEGTIYAASKTALQSLDSP